MARGHWRIAYLATRLLVDFYTHYSVDVAMVKNCCVVGCKNYVGKKQNLRFFRFPLTDKVRCEKWAAAVRRAWWQPVKSSRICNEHFVTV